MERTKTNEILSLKLTEALAAQSPVLTARDVRLPKIPGKPLAVIGVRRSGKTSLLHQQRRQRIAAGRPPESQLLLGLEDERLIGMSAIDLGWMLDEHARRYPTIRSNGQLTIYLDEIQLVSGWESLVHRLVEAKDIEMFVSGSSARLLSREVATAARGRLMDVLVHPFSFRETLRHAGVEPASPWEALSPTERNVLHGRLGQFLQSGGFPEAQGIDVRDRTRLLNGYVDTMVLRDVIERHAVSNVVALRALQRQLLANPGARFTVQKFFHALKSQGVTVGKDTLHAYLDHLQDAFLIRIIEMHSTSERQRMVNPRKVYPIDTGLIPIYDRVGRENRGHALETAVLLELERREYAVHWLRVGDDREVDFLANRSGEPPLLVQVCLDASSDTTWEREISALSDARERFPAADAILVTSDPTPPHRQLPAGIRWASAAEWLLG